jgi:hypothetical protein
MMVFEFIALVPLLPLLAALLIVALHLAGPAQGEAGEPLTARITLVAGSVSLLLLLGLALFALHAGAPGQVRLGNWFSSGDL